MDQGSAVPWSVLVEQAPELAAEVARRFAAHLHLTMATLRADGAPRISGTEAQVLGGRLWLGAMPDSVKVRDLRRDPRVALHSGSDDPEHWTGDAKVGGVAVEVLDAETRQWYLAQLPEQGPPGPFALFELRLVDASTVALGDPPDHLVITSWRPGAGVSRVQRR